MHFCLLQVARKTQQLHLNRTDAIFEVYTDDIIEQVQSCDRALLWIVSQEISEFSVCHFNSFHTHTHACTHACTPTRIHTHTHNLES